MGVRRCSCPSAPWKFSVLKEEERRWGQVWKQRQQQQQQKEEEGALLPLSSSCRWKAPPTALHPTALNALVLLPTGLLSVGGWRDRLPVRRLLLLAGCWLPLLLLLPWLQMHPNLRLPRRRGRHVPRFLPRVERASREGRLRAQVLLHPQPQQHKGHQVPHVAKRRRHNSSSISSNRSSCWVMQSCPVMTWHFSFHRWDPPPAVQRPPLRAPYRSRHSTILISATTRRSSRRRRSSTQQTSTLPPSCSFRRSRRLRCHVTTRQPGAGHQWCRPCLWQGLQHPHLHHHPLQQQHQAQQVKLLPHVQRPLKLQQQQQQRQGSCHQPCPRRHQQQL